MTIGREPKTEAGRLEDLWAGDFGKDYAARNAAAGKSRRPFWSSLFAAHPVDRVLEVGCNTGANLQWIAEMTSPRGVVGIDVSEGALRELRQRIPGVNAVWGLARELPFKDGWFDMAFTTGVLIHQPDESLSEVMSEIVRVSRRFVLCGEYFASETTEVAYRGERGALFKRDYGRLYLEMFPSLRLVDQGFLGQDDGWDDVTWWLLEKANSSNAMGRSI